VEAKDADVDDLAHTDAVARDRRLRRECPVANVGEGHWYVSTAVGVHNVLRDVDSFRADLAPMSGLDHIDQVPPDQLFLSEIRAPRHAQVRRIFNAWFGPARVRVIEPFVRTLCHSLVDQMLAREVADLHDGYAMQIPSRVMAEAMSLDASAAAGFMRWSYDGSILQRPCSPGVGPGRLEIQAFFAHELAARRAHPAGEDDLFQLLASTEIEGEPLTDQEIVTQLHFMIQAGVHTTRGLLAHLAATLLLDPPLFTRLRADRSLLAPLVEESLRHDPPAPVLTRRCTRDVELEGHQLSADDVVSVAITSANRDEAVYGDGDDFRLDRPDPRNHLGFGDGPHVCPGASLARMEGMVSVDVLLDRVVAMEAVPGAVYEPVPRGLSHAPIPARLVAAPH
jgi:cytochrome P450